jgi:signal transduction histidine kinase
MPLLHKIILFFLAAVLIMTLLFAYSFFNPEIINHIRQYTKILSIAILLLLFVVIAYGLRLKIQGAKYYLIGHGFFIFAIVYQQFGGIVNNETSFLSIYVVALSILLDILFLSLALNQRLTFLKHEKEKNERLLISQSGFSAIGRTVGNLSHQWKVPISRLGSLIMRMEAIVWRSEDKLKHDLKEILLSINTNLKFMQSSINEFNNFYSNSSQKIEFNLAREIDNILALLGEKALYSNAVIEKNLDYAINISGYKNAFANVCLIIIDNALDILKQRTINNGTIKISLEEKKNNILLTIEDTAGGIEIKPIEKVFDVFVTSKEDGTGMGLAMVKVLLNERLHGTIEVKNIENGASFKISFLKQS